MILCYGKNNGREIDSFFRLLDQHTLMNDSGHFFCATDYLTLNLYSLLYIKPARKYQLAAELPKQDGK
jgi:hypothetical protein